MGGLVGGATIWIYEVIVWVGAQHLMTLAGILRNATDLVFGREVKESLGAGAYFVGRYGDSFGLRAHLGRSLRSHMALFPSAGIRSDACGAVLCHCSLTYFSQLRIDPEMPSERRLVAEIDGAAKSQSKIVPFGVSDESRIMSQSDSLRERVTTTSEDSKCSTSRRAHTRSPGRSGLVTAEADSWAPERFLDFPFSVITRGADVLELFVGHLRQQFSLPRPGRPGSQGLHRGFEPPSQRLPNSGGRRRCSGVQKVYRHCIPRGSVA
jgi:hypothetical protein